MEKQLIHTNISVRLSISDRDYNIMSKSPERSDYAALFVARMPPTSLQRHQGRQACVQTDDGQRDAGTAFIFQPEVQIRAIKRLMRL